MIKKSKNYIIEVLENNHKTYFCINRSFGEIKYNFIDDIDKATKFDENQVNIYIQHHLKGKECNIIKVF